jgi:hypothetical protein
VKQYANQTPQVYWGYHQEDHWALEWEGAWEAVQDEQAVLGALRRSNEPGAALRLTFVGTELQLVVRQSSQGGTLGVSIDGQALPDVDLQSDRDAYGVWVPLARGLPDGQHQVELVHGGQPGTQVDVDGLLVRRRPRPWPLAVAIFGVVVVGFAIWFVAYRRRGQTSVVSSKQTVPDV